LGRPSGATLSPKNMNDRLRFDADLSLQIGLDKTLNSLMASPQSIPRVVWLDQRTSTNLLQWPIKEVQKLRHGKVTIKDVKLKAGEVARLRNVSGVQVFTYLNSLVPKIKIKNPLWKLIV